MAWQKQKWYGSSMAWQSNKRINALNLEATPGAKERILVNGPLKPPGKHDETEDEYNGTGTGK